MTSTPKSVLVTGCSTGIGRAAALRLSKAGHTVFASARRFDSIADLESHGCRLLELDVMDESSMADAVGAVLEEQGRIDALVNNAGYSLSGAVESLSIPDIRRQFETNVFGAVRMAQLVLPSMRSGGGGRIINIGSMGGNFTFPGGGAYHATKYAMEAFSDALRFEVKGFGVDVVLIQPGLIRSNFPAAAASAVPAVEGPYGDFNAAVAEATKASYTKGPLARLGGDPAAVATAIERAMTIRRPKPRVRVTPSAGLLMGLRRILTDRQWDSFVGTKFPTPGKGAAGTRAMAPGSTTPMEHSS